MPNRRMSGRARAGRVTAPLALLAAACVAWLGHVREADAICYCPVNCLSNYDNCDLLERAICGDTELQGQCEHALVEIEDYISGRLGFLKPGAASLAFCSKNSPK